MFSIFSNEGCSMSNRCCQEVQSGSVVHLLPPSLDEYVAADNPVRTIDAHVGMPDLWENWALGMRMPIRVRASRSWSGDPAEALHPWPPEPDMQFPLAGSRNASQHRSDVVVPECQPELQDDGRFPEEQCQGPEGGEPRVCRGLS